MLVEQIIVKAFWTEAGIGDAFSIRGTLYKGSKLVATLPELATGVGPEETKVIYSPNVEADRAVIELYDIEALAWRGGSISLVGEGREVALKLKPNPAEEGWDWVSYEVNLEPARPWVPFAVIGGCLTFLGGMFIVSKKKARR